MDRSNNTLKVMLYCMVAVCLAWLYVHYASDGLLYKIVDTMRYKDTAEEISRRNMDAAANGTEDSNNVSLFLYYLPILLLYLPLFFITLPITRRRHLKGNIAGIWLILPGLLLTGGMVYEIVRCWIKYVKLNLYAPLLNTIMLIVVLVVYHSQILNFLKPEQPAVPAEPTEPAQPTENPEKQESNK